MIAGQAWGALSETAISGAARYRNEGLATIMILKYGTICS